VPGRHASLIPPLPPETRHCQAPPHVAFPLTLHARISVPTAPRERTLQLTGFTVGNARGYTVRVVRPGRFACEPPPQALTQLGGCVAGAIAAGSEVPADLGPWPGSATVHTDTRTPAGSHEFADALYRCDGDDLVQPDLPHVSGRGLFQERPRLAFLSAEHDPPCTCRTSDRLFSTAGGVQCSRRSIDDFHRPAASARLERSAGSARPSAAWRSLNPDGIWPTRPVPGTCSLSRRVVRAARQFQFDGTLRLRYDGPRQAQFGPPRSAVQPPRAAAPVVGRGPHVEPQRQLSRSAVRPDQNLHDRDRCP